MPACIPGWMMCYPNGLRAGVVEQYMPRRSAYILRRFDGTRIVEPESEVIFVLWYNEAIKEIKEGGFQLDPFMPEVRPKVLVSKTKMCSCCEMRPRAKNDIWCTRCTQQEYYALEPLYNQDLEMGPLMHQGEVYEGTWNELQYESSLAF